VKHAEPLGEAGLGDTARETVERGLADAAIISGIGTGFATDFGDVELARRALPKGKILVGSGVNTHNAAEFMNIADGFIVGSSLKFNGKLASHVDQKRVAALAKIVGQ
jgi:hypothetical protein